MSYTNQFLPFALATGANVLGNNSYSALSSRLMGFSSGVAISQHVNTPLRQAGAMSSMLGAFIAAHGGDALDDGDLVTLQANFEAALAHIISASIPEAQDLSGYLLKSGGTMTGGLCAPAGLWTSARILTSSTSLSVSDFGKIIEITSPSAITLTLPKPAGYGGAGFKIWANSVTSHSMSSPIAGAFQGPGASGLTAMTIPAGAVFDVMSDGFNWVVCSKSFKSTSLPKMSLIQSTQTWTRADGATKAYVLAHGPGGAGGGEPSSSSWVGAGSGGGAGGWAMSLIDVSSMGSALVTIGSGGVIASGDGGDGGGNTSFGGLVVAGPGYGGLTGVGRSEPPCGGNGGVGITGDILGRGNPGQPPSLNLSGDTGGNGGGGLFGGGGHGGSQHPDTEDAQAGILGSGGGGADSAYPVVSPAAAGGSGFCWILEV